MGQQPVHPSDLGGDQAQVAQGEAVGNGLAQVGEGGVELFRRQRGRSELAPKLCVDGRPALAEGGQQGGDLDGDGPRGRSGSRGSQQAFDQIERRLEVVPQEVTREDLLQRRAAAEREASERHRQAERLKQLGHREHLRRSVKRLRRHHAQLRPNALECVLELHQGNVGAQVGHAPAAPAQEQRQEQGDEGVLLPGRAGDQQAPLPDRGRSGGQERFDAPLGQRRGEVLLLRRGLIAIPAITDLRQGGDQQSKAHALDRVEGQALCKRSFGSGLVEFRTRLEPGGAQVFQLMAGRQGRGHRDRRRILRHPGRILSQLGQPLPQLHRPADRHARLLPRHQPFEDVDVAIRVQAVAPVRAIRRGETVAPLPGTQRIGLQPGLAHNGLQVIGRGIVHPSPHMETVVIRSIICQVYMFCLRLSPTVGEPCAFE